MKTQRNILLAFLLNLGFAIFEFVGGILTGSIAIASDALHDLGDAVAIGISYFLEHKAQKQPDENYTYGYGRFSVLGGLLTTMILLFGSVLVIVKAVEQLFMPQSIDYDGMILFAVVGVAVNSLAALLTHHGESTNQRAVNLHMLEDVLGWAVVLIGAVVMRFTDFALLDPIMSIGVSVIILYYAVKNLLTVLALFLQKAPSDISVERIRACVGAVKGVEDVHHIHLWSMDECHHYASMHIVAEGDAHKIKDDIRHCLSRLGVDHVTLELEAVGEICHHRQCHVEHHDRDHCHHHH